MTIKLTLYYSPKPLELEVGRIASISRSSDHTIVKIFNQTSATGFYAYAVKETLEDIIAGVKP